MKKALLVLSVAALLAACNCSVSSKRCAGPMGGDPCSQYLSQSGDQKFFKHHRMGMFGGDEGRCQGQCNPWKNVPCKKVVVAPVVVAAPAPVPAPAPAPAPAAITSAELGKVAAVQNTATGQKITFTTPILFQTNSDKIQPQSNATIKTVAVVLKNHPNAKAVVEGYTDSLGDPAYNVSLSQKRADAVKNQLIADGVNAANLSAKGYGAANPIATNKTAAGRAQNRRVELNVTNQ